ncbi:hypothetical protein K8I31_11305, partial [bacterium]|nr:hypothetical protein [bacterium]
MDAGNEHAFRHTLTPNHHPIKNQATRQGILFVISDLSSRKNIKKRMYQIQIVNTMNEIESNDTMFEWNLSRDNYAKALQVIIVVALTMNALVFVWILSVFPSFFNLIK